MRRFTTTEQLVPAVQLGAALVLLAVLLPTILVQQPPQPPPSAEFSPAQEADEPHEVLIADVGRASSTTAGSSVLPALPADPIHPGAPAAPLPARSGACVGSPARQTESLYSTFCAPAWRGDNGGATTRGVTGSEISIGIVIGEADASYEGPVRPRHADETDAERRLRTWERYVNTRYELFGRRVRVVMVKIALSDDPATARAKVAEAHARWPLFGFFGGGAIWPAIDEALRRRIVVFEDGGEDPVSLFKRHEPFLFSFRMDADKLIAFSTEAICKQLVGRPPSFNERRDPTFNYAAPRKFGLILYEDGVRTGSSEMISAGLARCNARLETTVKMNLYDDHEGVAAAVTRLRAAGVTTVLMGTDFVTPILITNEAASSGYFPEWWTFGGGGQESNATARAYHPEQWRHALGLFYTEIPRPPKDTDCDVAYRSVDFEGSPGACWQFRGLQQFANGIQGAGPALTPTTFFTGLKRVPCHRPEPSWSIGGCYGDGDYTWADYVSFVWWDPRGREPSSSGDGAYRHVFGGRRFALGTLPADPVPWFADGITTPADPAQRT